MISFCKNSFNSLLRFPDNEDRRRQPSQRWRHLLPPPDRGGLHLLAADSPKPPHVVESPAVGLAGVGGKAADPGAWGLHDRAAGGGIGLCTESLGSESCDNEIEIDGGDSKSAEIEKRSVRRLSRRKMAEVRFPPPLPWMIGGSGRRRRFLKADRMDGRIVLTEIRIDSPPKILRAFRGDGRLRLELTGSEIGSSPEESPEESPEKLEIAGEEDSEISLEEDLGENGDRWALPVVRNDGQRCVETVIGDGSAPLWWTYRFVTTA